MENQKEKKCRVVIVITEEEKELLKVLARNDQRSMSSFIRCLLIQAINFEEYINRRSRASGWCCVISRESNYHNAQKNNAVYRVADYPCLDVRGD